MIRILRVVTRLNIGGPTQHVRVLSGQLDRARFQTLLLVGRPSDGEGDLLEAVRRHAHVVQIPELERSLHPWRDLVAWWRLVVVLVRFEPDIVHTHMAKAGALGRSAAWCANLLRRRRGQSPARVVHTFHGHVWEGYFSAWLAGWFLWCERWLARRSDRLIAINHSVEEALRVRRIGRPDQIAHIPLGLELDALLRLNSHAAASAHAPWRLGLVGRLVPVKNHRLLLEGLRRAHARWPGLRWRTAVIGDGPLRRGLEQAVGELGLKSAVEFLGWRLRLEEVYGDLDVVCLTSDNEGTPVALIEALAASKPVLATDVGGVGELLGGHCPLTEPFVVAPRGVVVRPRDPDALAEALAWAATHRDDHRRTAEAGHRHVAAQFRSERLVRDMEAFYSGLVTKEQRNPCTRS